MKVYKKISSLLSAKNNCAVSGNTEWEDKHSDNIDYIIIEYFPSGSGFDSGTTFDIVESNPEKLIFNIEYHHMDECGFYSRWSYHTLTITPSLQFGFNLNIEGLDVDYIQDYIHDVFSDCLNTDISCCFI